MGFPSLLTPSLPIQGSLGPGVDVTDDEDTDEYEHFDEAEELHGGSIDDLLENRRPGEKEGNFKVEQDEVYC